MKFWPFHSISFESKWRFSQVSTTLPSLFENTPHITWHIFQMLFKTPHLENTNVLVFYIGKCDNPEGIFRNNKSETPNKEIGNKLIKNSFPKELRREKITSREMIQKLASRIKLHETKFHYSKWNVAKQLEKPHFFISKDFFQLSVSVP